MNREWGKMEEVWSERFLAGSTHRDRRNTPDCFFGIGVQVLL
jgi:hypothetical protein